MAELPSKLKRKIRNTSGSEAVSPDGKKACEGSNKATESSADAKGKNRTSPSTMTEIIVQQLQIVLERLTSVERKLDGVLEKVQRLETALSGVQSDITDLQCKTTKMRKATDDMDAGLGNLNIEVQELWEKIDVNEKEIKLTKDRRLYKNSTIGGRICGFYSTHSSTQVQCSICIG